MGTLYGDREPLRIVGARIQFETSVPWEVMAFPPIASILRACSIEAPDTVGNLVVVTSTWRPEGPVWSWHQKGAAIDVRSGVDGATRPGSVFALTREKRIEVCRDWATRIKLRLGIEYDVVFGDPKHIDHIHIEHDGQTAMKTFRKLPQSTVT